MSGTGRTPTRIGPKGFSILEVIIVLGIIALFAGFFLGRFDSGQAEELLLRASTDLRSSALKSKKRSFTFRRNQYIIMQPQAFWTTENPPADGDGSEMRPGEDAEVFKLPAGVDLMVRPPGAKDWIKPKGVVWVFRSSGLSDPMMVRFTVGDSYTFLAFNVLTGLAEEETVIQ